jgi:phosphonate transport system substrate-binding protein
MKPEQLRQNRATLLNSRWSMISSGTRCRLTLSGALCCLLMLSGCQRSEAPAPSVLRVSAIPDQLPDRVLQQHEALVREVCKKAEVTCQWIPAPSYGELVAQIGRGEVDLAFLGGVTFVQAEHRHQVVPLAMRDIDFRFVSVVVVRDGDPARNLNDLKGRKFSFGNQLSTSGHFMARTMLSRNGLDPERDFGSVTYADIHDETMRRVSAGEVDAGAVNTSIFYQRLVEGDPVARSLRILWQSPPYNDYVWAGRRDLPIALRERLTDAFLGLDAAVPEHARALAHEGAKGFVPAFAADFEDVRAVVRNQRQL